MNFIMFMQYRGYNPVTSERSKHNSVLPRGCMIPRGFTQGLYDSYLRTRENDHIVRAGLFYPGVV